MLHGRPELVVIRCALALLALLAPAEASRGAPTARGAQAGAQARPTELVNGNMEDVGADGNLAGWFVPPALLDAGYVVGPEFDDAFRGAGAARIDSREAERDGNRFGNLLQSIDATPYLGKRVRYRAAVKVTEAGAGAQAQMWLRVDKAPLGGAPQMGFFDNMGDRPIAAGEWKTYEIVGDVAPDAQAIVLGVMSLGPCLVLVDEATLEVVSATSGGGMTDDPLARAPTQPFFTAWLALPLVALALFALGLLAPGRAGAFALRFALVYWALYALPTLVGNLVPVWGSAWSAAWEAGPVDAVVRWAARELLGIEGELVTAIGNGSGDSTYSYVQALLGLALALVVAGLWSLVDRRARDLSRPREVLRAGLRWYLAAYMIGYGLAKLGAVYNQFSVPGSDRLAATYGSSSPMGLLWTFIGASPAYMAFGGAMEVLGGALLVFRRTALLGALVSVSVMLNVMLMNFCYDVPVKLFSFHLVVAAACVALPDARRLGELFVGLRPGAPLPPRAPRTRLARVGGAYVVVLLLLLPLYQHWRTQSDVSGAVPLLGEWKLARLEADGQELAAGPGEVTRLMLSSRPVQAEVGWTTDYYATLVGGSSTYGKATLTADTLALAGPGGGPSRVIPGEFSWSVVGSELRLEAPTLRVAFAPAAQDYLLLRRGFRWINERPFNR